MKKDCRFVMSNPILYEMDKNEPIEVYVNVFWNWDGSEVIFIPRDPLKGTFGCHKIYLKNTSFNYGEPMMPCPNLDVLTGNHIFPKSKVPTDK